MIILMWLTVVVTTFNVFQLTSSCSEEATLHVYVEHFQNSYTSAYRYSKTVASSSGFLSAYKSFSTSASVSAGGGVTGLGSFSASASFALAKVGSETTSNSRFSESIEEQKTEYNPKFLQISRKVTSTFTIKNVSSKQIITEIVDSVPISSPLTSKQRHERSNTYLQSHFYDDADNIHGQSYSKTCHPPPTFEATLHGIYTGISSAEDFIRKPPSGWTDSSSPDTKVILEVSTEGLKIKDQGTGVVEMDHKIFQIRYIMVHKNGDDFRYVHGQGNNYKAYTFYPIDATKVVEEMKTMFDVTFESVQTWNDAHWSGFKLA